MSCRAATLAVAALLVVLLAGCAATPPDPDPAAYDPFEETNRRVYTFNENLDRYVAKPAADAYVFITPRFVRTGVTNFFNNAFYPGVVLNSALQGRWDETVRGSLRFLVNTTVGIGGLFDVATPMGFERKNRDFGQTLAGWGAPEGVYLVLPGLGASNTRDINDIPVSLATNPISYVAWTVATPLYALNLVNTRANLDQAARFRSEAALDEYNFTRSAYRQFRNNVIFDGDPPETDPFDDVDWDDDW